MAYDPKSFLDQALKTGFQSVYSQPLSTETGEAPQYQGDVATFGNVQVRPLMELVGQSEQDIGTSRQTGYAVDVPMTGKYEGWFRTDSYDNDGKFLGTSYNPPDNDKYGLKSLAQMGLMAASFGGLGPLAQGLASAYKGINAAKSGDILGAAASILPNVGLIPGVDKGLADTLKTAGGYAKTASALEKAIESKDVLGLLGAASDIPGVPKVPSDITDVLKGVGQANRIREAIRNEDPYAIFKEVVGTSKTGVPFSKLADVTGEDAIPGFFDKGGEGYYEGTIIPDWDVLPEARTTFTPGSDDVYEDIESLLARYENQGFADQPSGATDQTLEITGRRDDLNIDPWLQPFVDTERRVNLTEGEPQTIEVTGKREGTIIPDWDILPDAITAPRNIRDIGNVTKVSPDEPLEGTEIKEPDLVTGLTPAKVDTTKPTTPGTKPTTPTTPDTSKDPNLAWLAALLGAMGGDQGNDVRMPAQSNVARGTPESPFGLMYDLRG
jgi:hypothetical protein